MGYQWFTVITGGVWDNVNLSASLKAWNSRTADKGGGMEILLIKKKVCAAETPDFAQFYFEVLPRGVFGLMVIPHQENFLEPGEI